MPLNGFYLECPNDNPKVLRVKLFEKHGFLDQLTWTADDEGFKCFYMRFFNRGLKDVFMAVRKLFLRVRVLPFDKEIERLERVDGRLFNQDVNSSVGDLLILYDNLKATLSRSIRYTKQVASERDRALEYGETLEEELKAALKELRETCSRLKEGESIGKGHIQKLESSMLIAEQKIKERSMRHEGPKERVDVNEEAIRLKEELNKVKKLNELLAKELRSSKRSKKDQLAVFQQSLNRIKETNDGRIDREHQTHMAPSIHIHKDLDQSFFNDSSTNKGGKPAEPAELVQQNEVLKSELISLKRELKASKAELDDSGNNGASRVRFFVQCFDELRAAIDDIITNKAKEPSQAESYLDESFIKSVYKAGAISQVDLLNVENKTLNRRVNYVQSELNRLKGEQLSEYSKERLSRVSDIDYVELRREIDLLKQENGRLINEIKAGCRSDSLEANKGRKQVEALQEELRRLKSTTDQRETELLGQIDKKDRLIDQINKTNTQLIKEANERRETGNNKGKLSKTSRSFAYPE